MNYRTIGLGVIMFLVIFSACKAVDKLTQFDMDYSAEVVISKSLPVDLPFDVMTPSIPSNSEETFAVNDTRKDLIESIKLKKLELVITDPLDGDFDFLEYVAVYINADGLDEKKIASKEEIPMNAGLELLLDLEGVELKDYIKKDAFSLRLETNKRKITTRDYYIDINSVFRVDAKILGI